MSTLYRCLFVTFFIGAGVLHATEPADIPPLPVTFEKNLGQAPEGVRFVVRRAATGALLLDDRVVFRLGGSKSSTQVEMRWLGGADRASVEGLDKLPKNTDYILGNKRENWVFGVPSYERVRYNQVYPGIDLEFHRQTGDLEYDFIVSPGADPSAIRLSFNGQEEAALTDDGALELRGQGGVVEHRKPLLYQTIDGERRLVDGRFVKIARNEFRFETADYDRSRALIVDPHVTGRRYGGSLRDTVTAVTVFNEDEIAAAGVTDLADFVPNAVPAGGKDGFVVHLRGVSGRTFVATNELVFGGIFDDVPTEIIRGPQSTIFGGNKTGQVVIGGYTESPDFMFGSPQGLRDAFIGAYTPGEDYVLGVRYGSTGNDEFGHFARRTHLGEPHTSIADYDKDGDLDIYTTTRIATDSVGEYLQIREWDAGTFGVRLQRDIFGLSGGCQILDVRFDWYEYEEDDVPKGKFVFSGTANGSLFPAASHPGSLLTQKVFGAWLPIDGPSSDPTPQPLENVLFPALPDDQDYTGADFWLMGMALPPVTPPGETPHGYLAAKLTGGPEFGAYFAVDFSLTPKMYRGLSFSNAVPKSLAFNRNWNLVGAWDIYNNNEPSDYLVGGFVEVDPKDSSIVKQEIFGSLSRENHLSGATPGIWGNNFYPFGTGDLWPVTDGSTEIQGTTDGWIGRVESLGLPPDGIVTAGQFKWAPLVPYGAYSAFIHWPRIPGLNIPAPVNGVYGKTIEGMQLMINDEPAAIIGINGTQVNFIAHNNVNMGMEPMASVQLIYDDPVDSEHFESNTVWMPTADRWISLFEAGTIAAGYHNNGIMTPQNPIPENGFLATFFSGGGSFGHDSIGADELTPMGVTMEFPSPKPQVQAFVEGGPTFDVNVAYFGLLDGYTPTLGQMNLTFPEEFWSYCRSMTNVEFTLRVTDTATGAQQEYVNPLGGVAEPISDTQAFATCP